MKTPEQWADHIAELVTPETRHSEIVHAIETSTRGAARVMDLVDALGWALGQITISWTGRVEPDNPAWNEFRRAQRVLEGLDPDEELEA